MSYIVLVFDISDRFILTHIIFKTKEKKIKNKSLNINKRYEINLK